MILRPISLADLDGFVAFTRQAFEGAFGHLYSPGDLAAFFAEHRSRDKFAAAIGGPDASITLAEEGGEWLGYSVMYFREQFAERPDPKPRQPSVLSQLYCLPQATGRGVGAALMGRALTEAATHGCDAIQLSVYSENLGAQRFYQRYGFQHIADIDFWVGNHRDDEYLYERAI